MKYRKNDTILIIIALLIAFMFFLITNINQSNIVINDAQVIVTINKEVYGTYNLNENMEIKIDSAYGYNVLKIENGVAYVSDADCRDGVCMSQRGISKRGETIICLPHKLVVEIKGGENGEFDAVVN